MNEVELRVIIGNPLDELIEYDHREEENNELLPPNIDDDSPDRRFVWFAQPADCDRCGSDCDLNELGACSKLIDSVELDSGETIELPKTMSAEFLDQGVMSFGNHGTIFNLTYEQVGYDEYYEEHAEAC